MLVLCSFRNAPIWLVSSNQPIRNVKTYVSFKCNFLNNYQQLCEPIGRIKVSSTELQLHTTFAKSTCNKLLETTFSTKSPDKFMLKVDMILTIVADCDVQVKANNWSSILFESR